MSESITPIDLSAIAVNGSGKIDLSTLKTAYVNPTEQLPAHIRIYNDSGSTLNIRSDSGTLQDYIPAGAWPTFAIDHSIQTINFTVIAILPNPPIQLLMATYFSPGEEVPPVPQLGNSPVGIGGSVPLNAIATSVSNTGNAAPTAVVTGQATGAVSPGLLLNNDGSGNVGGGLISFNTSGKTSSAKALGGANQAYFEGAPPDGLTFDISEAAADHSVILVINGAIALRVHPTKGTKPREEGFFISGLSEFSGPTSGTYNHNLGTTPDGVIPVQSVAGSQTMGFNTLGATTVNVVCGNGSAFTALVYQLNS